MIFTQRSKDSLKKVYALLQDEKHWTQGVMARDDAGKSVWPTDEKAVQWCMLGAIDRIYVTDQLTGSEFQTIVGHLNHIIGHDISADMDIGAFNDSFPHIRILELLDTAIHQIQL